VLLAAGDLGRLVLGLVRRASFPTIPDPERREFLTRAFGIGVGVTALGLAAYGISNALGQVAVKPVRIALRRWSLKAAGYTIVQLSDIHVGPTIGREFIEGIVARVNALAPDLVVITGDLVDGSVAQLGELVAPLAGLRAKDGVYFVPGNHEYYSGLREWLSFVEGLGIRVLMNERVSVGGEHGFDLAGVDDPTGSPDVARALEGRDTDRAVVLLAHQPKTIFDAAKHGVDLQLSGHTHGGQLFPFHGLVRLQQPYVAGLHDHEGTKIYVSRGTGYWGPPMRVAAPAEITKIELVGA
jgi:predicted MPP superfamily phosphohydrolase